MDGARDLEAGPAGPGDRAALEEGLMDLARAELFNEWMRRYIETPHEFEAEFNTVTRFLTEQAKGKEPSYGEACVAYLKHLDQGRP